MSDFFMRHGLGWIPDRPDIRDFSTNTKEIVPIFKKLNLIKGKGRRAFKASNLPSTMDVRQFCPPIEDQENIGSCTANAGVGLLEYYERRAFGAHLDASRLFLYKVTRKLLQWEGDTGAFLRTTMGAMTLFGVPPTKYYPYDVSKYDDEPPAFCYAFAASYKALKYYRLDPPNTSASDIITNIKSNLTAWLPSMFGFTVYSSIWQAGNTGMIPFPAAGDTVEGGHAIVAVGYDDDLVIKHPNGTSKTKGAFLIRNSWGTGWGDGGYGWLPYEYVLQGQATDWWSLISTDYVDTGRFGL